MHSERVAELRAELRELKEKPNYDAADLVRLDEIGEAIAKTISDKSRKEVLDSLGAPPDVSDGGTFANAIRTAGYDRVNRPSVLVETKAVTFSGTFSDAVRVDRPAPPLGADARFLYPSLPRENVDPDTTSVASYRQSGRTLPSPVSSMIRDLAAVTEKPEVTTTTELLSEPLKQIAVTNQSIPNIMLESRMLASWVEADLRYSYSVAVDAHVTTEIAAAGPQAAPAGADALGSILLAAETVAAEGYSPTILAASPEFLIELRLAVQPGTGDYIFSGNELDLGLSRVAVAGLDAVYVIDPSSLGTLYLSPVRFATFEENSGQTNSSTARVESNGVFVVQRVGAVAEVAVSS